MEMNQSNGGDGMKLHMDMKDDMVMKLKGPILNVLQATSSFCTKINLQLDMGSEYCSTQS
jgi:hypothetical protein